MKAWQKALKRKMAVLLLVGGTVIVGCASKKYILVESESTFFVPAGTEVRLPIFPVPDSPNWSSDWKSQTRTVIYDSYVTEESQHTQVIEIEQSEILTDGEPSK